MLILTRKAGESVDCSRNGVPLLVVKVLALLPNGVVRLGFEADRSVSILRDNALTRIEEQYDENSGDGFATETNGNR